MAKDPHIEILAARIPYSFEEVCSPQFEDELDAMAMDPEHVLAALCCIHGYQLEEGIPPTPTGMATLFIDDIAASVWDEAGDPSNPESWEECDRKIIHGIGRFKPELIHMAAFVHGVLGQANLPVQAVETRRYANSFFFDLALTKGRK